MENRNSERGVTLKELVIANKAETKEMLLRIETTFNSKIDTLNSSILATQASSITKAEFNSIIETLQREVSRIETQYREGLRDIKQEFREQVKAIETDIKASTQRLIAGAGLLIVVVQFFLTNLN